MTRTLTCTGRRCERFGNEVRVPFDRKESSRYQRCPDGPHRFNTTARYWLRRLRDMFMPQTYAACIVNHHPWSDANRSSVLGMKTLTQGGRIWPTAVINGACLAAELIEHIPLYPMLDIRPPWGCSKCHREQLMQPNADLSKNWDWSLTRR